MFTFLFASTLNSSKHAEPVLNPVNEAFFRNQARRLIASARLRAGESLGGWRNSTPYDIHVPGGNMGYHAFWVRDAVMMLGRDFISANELEGWIRLIAGTLRGPKSWVVRPGVVVPSCTVPDHINLNGMPTFYPGNYDTGREQGGRPWGKYPPLDDNFYFVTAVYEHWKMTRSARFFRSSLATSFGEIKLADLCEKIYRAPLTDPPTVLIIAGNVKKENAKDWGFCDAEFKSGKLLFPSILKFIAANQLAKLFKAAGEPAKALRYRQEAAVIKRSIPPTFFYPAKDKHEGWLHSATGVGNQPDVWGSAFAVWSGAIEGEPARAVSRALIRAFREKTAVRQGLVRQILTSDPTNHGGWQCSVAKRGTYQNGGYWGVPTGWYISAISHEDGQAAIDMAADYIQFIRNNLRPDGLTQAWEWFNPDTGQRNNPLYVATVALPYISMGQADLLSKW